MYTKRIFVNAIVVLFCFLIESCLVEDKVPEVEKITPGHQTMAPVNTIVKVKFSEKMNKFKTEEAFKLLCGEEEVDGSFAWNNDGNELKFKPELNLRFGACYKIKISSDAVDTKNNKIRSEKSSSFFAGDDLNPPEISSFYPTYSDRFPLNGDIKIKFSRPMNKQSFERGFSINPYVNGYFTWDETSMEVNYKCFEKYSFRQVYTVQISSDILDANGNKLIGEKEYYFIAGDDFENPSVVYLKPTSTDNPSENWALGSNYSHYTGVEKDSSLLIGFSKEVDKNSLKKSFSIIPAVSFNILWTSKFECKIIFQSNLSVNDEYEVRINNDLSDLAGNHYNEQKIIYFMVNGVESIRPNISSIMICDTNGPFTKSLILNEVVENLVVTSDDCYIRIIFSEDIVKSSFPGNISIARVSGIGNAFDGALKSITWDIGSSNAVTVRLGAIGSQSVYKFVIKGGEGNITNLDNVSMKNDRVYYFSIQ